jgi:hypothetical protein
MRIRYYLFLRISDPDLLLFVSPDQRYGSVIICFSGSAIRIRYYLLLRINDPNPLLFGSPDQRSGSVIICFSGSAIRIRSVIICFSGSAIQIRYYLFLWISDPDPLLFVRIRNKKTFCFKPKFYSLPILMWTV